MAEASTTSSGTRKSFRRMISAASTKNMMVCSSRYTVSAPRNAVSTASLIDGVDDLDGFAGEVICEGVPAFDVAAGAVASTGSVDSFVDVAVVDADENSRTAICTMI